MRSCAAVILLCLLNIMQQAGAQTYSGRTNTGGFGPSGDTSIDLLLPTRMSSRDPVPADGRVDTVSIGEATISIEGVAHDPSGVHRVFVNGVPAALSDSGTGAYFSTTFPVTMRGDLVEVRAVGKSGNQQSRRFVVRRLFKGQYWAVVIGISEYQDSEIPRLRYAHEDAIAFYRHLTTPLTEGGGGVPRANAKLLVNGEATTMKMRTALTDFLKQPTEDDVVYVYFSGHGMPDPDRPDVLYFGAFDTDRTLLGSTALPMRELHTTLNSILKARTVLVFVDACHSNGVTSLFATKGMLATAAQVDTFLVTLAESRPSTFTFAASDVNQLSQEDKRWGGGHGVFTYHLLEALKGAADFNKDKIVRLGEAVQYVSDKVRRDTRSQQSPISSGAYDGNIPLSIVPGK